MKPGGGKTHKACAALCISGGIPPMFVTRDGNGQETFYLLTTAASTRAHEPSMADRGPANRLVLPFVGEAVEVEGRLERHGDLRALAIQPGGIRRR